jgi:PPM family protein phosphatase
MATIESAGITDVGRKRKGNEDSLLLDDDLKLYIVADGMGGHLAGEVASRLVVQTIHDYLKRFRLGEKVEELADSDESLSREANRLLAGIHLANSGVNRLSLNNDAYRGMGSTVSAVYFADNVLVAANVGDSPIYLIHNHGIERLSVPHTVLAEQAVLNPQGVHLLGEEYRHMLTRAVGVAETVEPDACEVQCMKGDVLVMSSDGLSDKVSPEEILEVVADEKPDKAASTLVNMANERGGEDNITVIVVRIRSVGQRESRLGRLLSRLFG